MQQHEKNATLCDMSGVLMSSVREQNSAILISKNQSLNGAGPVWTGSVWTLTFVFKDDDFPGQRGSKENCQRVKLERNRHTQKKKRCMQLVKKTYLVPYRYIGERTAVVGAIMVPHKQYNSCSSVAYCQLTVVVTTLFNSKCYIY